MAKRVPLQISVPPVLKAWIEQRVARGEFSSPAACIESALRRARFVQSREELQALAIEGVERGGATPLTKKDWRRLEMEVRSRAAARRTRRKSA